MTVNDPHIVAELRTLYTLYEQALLTNYVEKLVEMFWRRPMSLFCRPELIERLPESPEDLKFLHDPYAVIAIL